MEKRQRKPVLNIAFLLLLALPIVANAQFAPRMDFSLNPWDVKGFFVSPGIKLSFPIQGIGVECSFGTFRGPLMAGIVAGTQLAGPYKSSFYLELETGTPILGLGYGVDYLTGSYLRYYCGYFGYLSMRNGSAPETAIVGKYPFIFVTQ